MLLETNILCCVKDQVGGSSPDLVSLRGGLRISSAAIPQYTVMANPTPYRTYTNLADPHQVKLSKIKIKNWLVGSFPVLTLFIYTSFLFYYDN